MSEESDAEKTEDPSAKKIEDALSKGQTPSSREPAVLASLLVFTAFLAFQAEAMIAGSRETFRSLWSVAGTMDASPANIATLGQSLAGQVGLTMLPLLVGLMLAGLVAGLVQAEPRFVIERIRPKGERVSLVKGWSRVFGKRGLVEFAKSLVKIGVAGTVAGLVITAAVPELSKFMRRSEHLFLDVTAGIVLTLVSSVAVLMLVVAIADLLWSRHVWREGLKMTRKEVSDETKQSEGDPILKSRRRSLARDRSRRRMLEAVPTATMVIANPTHVAVALRYRHDEDAAPVVVAKGGDHLCLKIRALAEANDVPVFERIELARAIYKVAEVDRPIPEVFYKAVAELVNFVMDPARAR